MMVVEVENFHYLIVKTLIKESNTSPRLLQSWCVGCGLFAEGRAEESSGLYHRAVWTCQSEGSGSLHLASSVAAK